MKEKKSIILILYALFGCGLSYPNTDCCDTLYDKSFKMIEVSDCILNNLKVKREDVIYCVSNEVLKLHKPEEIDTGCNSFYKDEMLYPKSYVIHSCERLKELSFVNEDVFLDTSKLKVVIFFSEIKNNYLIAEVYLYNYFPIIDSKFNIEKDIEYRKTYNYLRDFDIIARFLFSTVEHSIGYFKCY